MYNVFTPTCKALWVPIKVQYKCNKLLLIMQGIMYRKLGIIVWYKLIITLKGI